MNEIVADLKIAKKKKGITNKQIAAEMRSHIKTLRCCLLVMTVSVLLLVAVDLFATNIGWLRF